MANAAFNWPADNIAPAATWTPIVGTVDTVGGYQANFVADLIVSRPARFLESTVTLRGTFGTFVVIRNICIPMHNFKAPVVVRLQNNVGLNHLFTVPMNDEDDMPVPIYVNLEALYDVSLLTATNWDLLVIGNATPVAIGEVMLHTVNRAFSSGDNIQWELTETDVYPQIEHKTRQGVVTVYDDGVRVRLVEGSSEPSQSGFDACRSLYRACKGRYYPFLFVLDPDIPKTAMMCRWSQSSLMTPWIFIDHHQVPLSFEEDSRGPNLH